MDAQHEPGEDQVEELDGLPGGVELEDLEEAEELDGVPVFDHAGEIEPRRPALLPVPVQAAAVAVSGFVVGLLTILFFQRRRARRPARTLVRRGRRRDEPATKIVASRSFLVDVHLLGRD